MCKHAPQGRAKDHLWSGGSTYPTGALTLHAAGQPDYRKEQETNGLQVS
jgi:hypothetical protein